MSSRENSNLVYATVSGRVKAAPSPAPTRTATTDGVVRIGFSKQGRGGKPVTTISGAPLDLSGLDDYARALKQKCGCGGTVRDGIVEIQGDKRDLVLTDALARGWKAKKAGG